MFNLLPTDDGATELFITSSEAYRWWLRGAAEVDRHWLETTGFAGEPDAFIFLPAAQGARTRVLAVTGASGGSLAMGGPATSLPPGRYTLAEALPRAEATAAALGWALGGYAFDRYKAVPHKSAQLVWPPTADQAEVARIAGAVFLARDLINTPAEDLGPADLADVARTLALEMGADIAVTTGADLLAEGYPTIHAVGRASVRPPCLIDLRWGQEGAPRVTLVGKGVCFDSGGLNLKSAQGMQGMKRDMGGAAVVLGLGRALMEARAPIRLRILVPAVDNAVSGWSIRPLDVVRTRSGKTVEIGDTDAEGRLILCDALAEADSEHPDLLIDCATLTGAARIALGTEVQALFCDDDALAAAFVAAGQATDDPLWRMPIWRPYRKLLESKVSDLSNIADTASGGAITAAVFLADFVEPTTAWAHLDINAANTTTRPGRPEGGEATGLRALYAVIRARYG